LSYARATGRRSRRQSSSRSVPAHARDSTIPGSPGSYTQVYGFGSAFGKATAPLPQLASVAGLGWLGHFIAIGITCSMFACTLACLTAGLADAAVRCPRRPAAQSAHAHFEAHSRARIAIFAVAARSP
jgi:hypothetical protein